MQRVLVYGFAFVLFAAWGQAESEPGKSRTLNMKIDPQWVDAQTLQFVQENAQGEIAMWQCDATTGRVERLDRESTASANGLRGGRVPRSGPSSDSVYLEFVNNTSQNVTLNWVDTGGRRTGYGELTPGKTRRQHTFIGHVWEVIGEDGTFYGSVTASPLNKQIEIQQEFERPRPRQRRNRNRERVSNEISGDLRSLFGVDHLEHIQSSPSGNTVIGFVKESHPALEVYTIESSPPGGGRAVLHSQPYRLPGDPMDRYRMVAMNRRSGEAIEVDLPEIDFGRPRTHWCGPDSLLVEKIDRGHQRFRLYRIDLVSGSTRVLIDEQTDTFLWTMHGPPVPLLTYLDSDQEAIYASERSGHRHLYLVDLSGEQPLRPITQGDYLVRELLHVDTEERFLDLLVGASKPDQDPYHRHLVRVDLESGELTPISEGDGDHEATFSPDRRFVVLTYSRVDMPPVHELRRMSDGKLIRTLCRAERVGDSDSATNLPIRFSAPGRDGKTEIWGFICLPERDATSDQVPVIEAIYAGPHDAHVPKRYQHSPRFQAYTSRGFAVVKIDGMGTANRSKSFHDVCWHNLKDAGFPDRIAWMKAAAKKYPVLDLSRVGIFGGSAGGQNACGAVLFHHDFYKAAVASCGCHDNRMDKASWNEQWMGYPVGPHYAASSNIEHADKLGGQLMLILGELDQNVPPESTTRLVDALIRADKDFEFVLIPGAGHGDGGRYGERKRIEFFVKCFLSDATHQP